MSKQESAAFLSAVETFCQAEGIRFTDARRHVTTIISSSDKPLGAYDVLAQLAVYIDNPKPPTVYRAIEFLLENKFIHRIESLNAYVTCQSDHRHTGSQFLVCTKCSKVIESHLCSLPPALKASVDKEGFTAQSWNVEIHGLCADCS
jgi:Fur family zinc uptake transcriptional regulator|tara:strand:- start:21745 stop:22185 length:441 start_codon:yes stop_codon:yes gene_type:complete